MMGFCRKALKKIKLIVLYFTRIIFVRNNFEVSLWNKLKSNLFGGFIADQYVLYDLKNNDKDEFLSEFDWYRSRYINEPFDFAFNNKVICSEILKHHIRTPENYFIKNKDIIYDFSEGVRKADDVCSFLKEKRKLFIKPFALGKGNGVHMLEAKEGEFFIDGNKCSDEEFICFLDNENEYIICEYMEQHVYAKDLFDRTVNTIRLITIRDIYTHEFKVFFAVQRIGRESTIPVDNGSKGGLVAKIDIETGNLSEARCLHDLNIYCIHPDSGNHIEGIQIPKWEEIKKEVLEVCKKLPYMDFIAWDLLLTEEGLCMIEANTSSGVNILQLWGGQRQGELGAFFRYHGVIN